MKPKQTERRDSSVDVETRQQLETVVDTPPFMDDKKSEKLKPVSINERRESSVSYTHLTLPTKRIV